MNNVYPFIRSSLLATLVTMSLFAIVSYTACKQDKCKDIACLNGGACQDGSCICVTGYTGIHCETPPTPDPCASITCHNGGTCHNGSCNCPSGYSGPYCDTAANAVFVGTWTGTDCSSNAVSITVSAGTGPFAVTIPGSVGSASCFKAITINCTVSGNTLTISSQSFSDQCGNSYGIAGNGTLTGGSLHMNLTTTFITAGGNVTTCFDGVK